MLCIMLLNLIMFKNLNRDCVLFICEKGDITIIAIKERINFKRAR